MTVTLPAPAPVAAGRGETRVVLEPISWALYQQILRELGDNRGQRLAYDNGRLEIMSPSNLHEDVKKIAARLIEAYGDATGIDVQGFGSWTMDREASQKGIEPDECYYVQSFQAIAHKRPDLAVDPPPDLARSRYHALHPAEAADLRRPRHLGNLAVRREAVHRSASVGPRRVHRITAEPLFPRAAHRRIQPLRADRPQVPPTGRDPGAAAVVEGSVTQEVGSASRHRKQPSSV
jgi:hypothetical protein